MKEIKQDFILFLTLVVIFTPWILFSVWMGSMMETEEQRVIKLCAEIAPMRQEQYKDTQWKHMDFYKSCINNVLGINSYDDKIN